MACGAHERHSTGAHGQPVHGSGCKSHAATHMLQLAARQRGRAGRRSAAARRRGALGRPWAPAPGPSRVKIALSMLRARSKCGQAGAAGRACNPAAAPLQPHQINLLTWGQNSGPAMSAPTNYSTNPCAPRLCCSTLALLLLTGCIAHLHPHTSPLRGSSPVKVLPRLVYTIDTAARRRAAVALPPATAPRRRPPTPTRSGAGTPPWLPAPLIAPPPPPPPPHAQGRAAGLAQYAKCLPGSPAARLLRLTCSVTGRARSYAASMCVSKSPRSKKLTPDFGECTK